jgi:hypothetical protein
MRACAREYKEVESDKGDFAGLRYPKIRQPGYCSNKHPHRALIPAHEVSFIVSFIASDKGDFVGRDNGPIALFLGNKGIL